MAQTLQEFAQQHAMGAPGMMSGGHPFEVINDRFLRVNLGSAMPMVYMKMGVMVAYTGDLKFEREGILEHGFRHAMKKALTDEGATLVRASCSKSGAPSQLFLADEGKSVLLLRLTGDSIVVNGNDLLAFEPSIKHKIAMMRKMSSIVSGGLFNVRLEGQGFVAILTHGRPVTIPVGPGLPPVFSDPEATVAWSGNLVPDFHTDVSFKTLIGRSSGESFQMKFVAPKGAGFIVIQPFEEHPPPPQTA
ncbi:hypothetical protein L7F22_022327 [Adiantum nelumboides]|nr:hypothetical protein [Adiantum nelumboides]